jgi:hypothetical protein
MRACVFDAVLAGDNILMHVSSECDRLQNENALLVSIVTANSQLNLAELSKSPERYHAEIALMRAKGFSLASAPAPAPAAHAMVPNEQAGARPVHAGAPGPVQQPNGLVSVVTTDQTLVQAGVHLHHAVLLLQRARAANKADVELLSQQSVWISQHALTNPRGQ